MTPPASSGRNVARDITPSGGNQNELPRHTPRCAAVTRRGRRSAPSLPAVSRTRKVGSSRCDDPARVQRAERSARYHPIARELKRTATPRPTLRRCYAARTAAARHPYPTFANRFYTFRETSCDRQRSCLSIHERILAEFTEELRTDRHNPKLWTNRTAGVTLPGKGTVRTNPRPFPTLHS